jgi:chemotaxis signal transduction protein
MDPRAARLRDAFDGGFALPPQVEVVESDDFLLLRAAGAPYAMRVAEIAGIAARKTVVPVPSGRPELLGLAGIRGALVCVYSLSRLLGQAGAEQAVWLALLALDDAEPVALAFDELEGFLRVPRALVLEQPASRADARVRSLVQAGSTPRPVIDLSTIAAVIQSAGAAGPTRSSP